MPEYPAAFRDRRPQISGKTRPHQLPPLRFYHFDPAGVEAARDIYSRHEILEEFFMDTLHLSPEEAEANTCRIEHVIDHQAIEGLLHLQVYEDLPPDRRNWRAAFNVRSGFAQIKLPKLSAAMHQPNRGGVKHTEYAP